MTSKILDVLESLLIVVTALIMTAVTWAWFLWRKASGWIRFIIGRITKRLR